MDRRIIIRYEGNNSSRYDGKQFYKLSLRVQQINGSEDHGISSFAFIRSLIIVIASTGSLKRCPDPSNLLSVPCLVFADYLPNSLLGNCKSFQPQNMWELSKRDLALIVKLNYALLHEIANSYLSHVPLIQ